MITMLSMYNPKFRMEQVEPFPARDDVTVRKYYRPIIEKTDHVMEPKMLVGTVEGKLHSSGVVPLETKRFDSISAGRFASPREIRVD